MKINKRHPGDVGLTYWGHLKFAWGESIRGIWVTIFMFVHGLIPWIWDWKFDAYLKEAHKRVTPQAEARAKTYGEDNGRSS